MYSETLEHLIDAALADGKLTAKEKQILLKRAKEEGVDLDEFEMVLSARVIQANKTNQNIKYTPNTPSADNYIMMAKNAMQSNNFLEAEQYSNKIIEIMPDYPDAWVIKGLSAGWMSAYNHMRFNEVLNCFQNAINLSDNTNRQRITEETVTGMKNLNFAFIQNACNNIYNGYLDYISLVQWLMNYIYQYASPFITSNSASADDLLLNVGNYIFNTAINTFENFRVRPAGECINATKVSLLLLDIFAEIPTVPKEDKKNAYKYKIEYCDYILDIHIGREYDQMRAPLIDYYDEIIKDARSKIRKLNPPKPKKAKIENTNEDSINASKSETNKKISTKNKKQEIIYWENVIVTDSTSDIKRLKFEAEITKSSLWGGLASDYGVRKAIEKIQKEAANRGCCLAYISEIDTTIYPRVKAMLYKK